MNLLEENHMTNPSSIIQKDINLFIESLKATIITTRIKLTKQPFEDCVEYWNNYTESTLNEYTLVLLSNFPEIAKDIYEGTPLFERLAKHALSPYLYFDQLSKYKESLLEYINCLEYFVSQI